MSDVCDTDVYVPKPTWWTSDKVALGRMFPTYGADAFVQVCGGVQDGAVYDGSGYMSPAAYTNPDGTDGDGVPKAQP
jgi:hypothetical protein